MRILSLHRIIESFRKSVRVLAIDDEADAHHLIKRILTGCGAEVETAGSGAGALRALRKAKPDVLIMDIGMPGEDGCGVMGKVRQLPSKEGGDVPAIALTAFAARRIGGARCSADFKCTSRSQSNHPNSSRWLRVWRAR